MADMERESIQIEFRTERLFVRTISSSDAQAIAQFYGENSDHFAPWEPSYATDLSLSENVTKAIGKWLEEYDSGTAIRFLIFLKGEEKNLIAVVNFSQIFHGSFQACYLGFKVDHRYEGRGIMIEAIEASLEHMFVQEGLHRIMANYIPSNMRSARLLERLGFVKEGYAEKYLAIGGRWQDHVLTALNKERWECRASSITVREYNPEDVQSLANIYYNTIHQVNIQHYAQEQVDVWAPRTSLETGGWSKKFLRTTPFVAVAEDQVVGFAEFEPNGHIDCFFSHHDWMGRGVGMALMKKIHEEAQREGIVRLFSEVSITARPFFERHGFVVVGNSPMVREGVSLAGYKMEKLLGLREELNG